jgi:hypothetical protein
MKTKFKTKTINGERYMICRNSIEDKKHWSWPHLANTERCDRYSIVSGDTTSILCYKCTMKTVPKPKINKGYVSSGRPRGWQFMKEFVDKEGNVFHKGVEQPKLKGKLQPTVIKPSNKKKLTKKEKAELKLELQKQLAFHRGAMKKATLKKDVKAHHVKVSRIQRKLKKL